MNMLDAQRQGESLYTAVIATLDEIPDINVRSDVTFNLIKYMATERAKAASKNKDDDLELAGLFEAECKRVCTELMALSGQFREWAGKSDEERQRPAVQVIEIRGMPMSLVDLVLGSCNCEHCQRYRRGESPLDDSEAKTEPPPPEAKPS